MDKKNPNIQNTPENNTSRKNGVFRAEINFFLKKSKEKRKKEELTAPAQKCLVTPRISGYLFSFNIKNGYLIDVIMLNIEKSYCI